ncbi:MAG: amidinotransferase [Crocinitomicaceae bacterium]|nr:amidinotransferase [Crocinitomicaceae bacterium]
MIRPLSFGFNAQTSDSNAFQQNLEIKNVSLAAQAEFDSMVEKLKAHSIAVKIFDDQKVGLPDSVFSNNWMAHLPEKKLVVFPMYTPNRRAEVRVDIIDWIAEHGPASIRIDLVDRVNQNKFLEGTGSIVFDYQNKIAFACESPRTDVQLFEEFCSIIGYVPFSFQSFDLNGKLIYHTNVLLTIANHYALVCLESVENPMERKMLEIKLRDSHHELILLTHQQMNLFAGNCIEVLNEKNESCLLMSKTAFDTLTMEQKHVIGKYSQIIWFEIPTIESIGGGSVRCMITGLFAD